MTLTGDVTLGGLSVDAGELAIGDGTSANTASFESAVIDAGATVYIAKNATLLIRIPNDIINNGHLINDGTVHDDLANKRVVSPTMTSTTPTLRAIQALSSTRPRVLDRQRAQ